MSNEEQIIFLMLQGIKEKAYEIDSIYFGDIDEERKASNIREYIVERVEMIQKALRNNPPPSGG